MNATQTEAELGLKIKSLDGSLGQLKSERDGFKTRIEQLEAELRQARLVSSVQATTEAKFFERLTHLEANLQLERSEGADRRTKFEVASRERDMLRKLIEARDQRDSAEEHFLNEKAEQVKQAEAKLSSEKAEVRKFSKILAEEIQSAMAVHPLHDYLRMTEFELSKTELQLKKTPSSHPERPRLETSMVGLLEQRDFLQSIIVSSQRQLQEQASAVLRISHDEKLDS